MKLPQVKFKYSFVYDGIWQKEQGAQKQPVKKSEKYPSAKATMEFIEILEKLWRPREKDILSELSRVTTLPWVEDTIVCYVVGRSVPFSDPLTIPAYKGYEDFAMDVLTHELIHRIFIQEGNEAREKSAWNYCKKQYGDFAWNTWIHVPVHAIHEHILRTFFDEKRLQREKSFMSTYPDYKNAWDIVEKEGYQTIIDNFVKRLK